MSLDETAAEPAEPWRSFLIELDACLTNQIELRCFGGFVVAQHYGLGRETSDIDFVAAIIESRTDDLEHLAGMHSGLHLQHVGIATLASDYAQRLTRMFPNAPWTRLKHFALDATDLALSKLERNAERDREDCLRLAAAGLLDVAAFKERYADEVRPYMLGNLTWHDKTVELWLAMASSLPAG
jgi:hypothetical protein